jgi:hypothetical protein
MKGANGAIKSPVGENRPELQSKETRSQKQDRRGNPAAQSTAPPASTSDIDRLIAENAVFADIHRRVASAMGEGKLICLRCKREEPLTVDQVEKYLRTGWPKCCGSTMGYYGPITEKVSV